MWSTTLYVSVEARGSYRRGHVSINGSILVGADATVRNIIFICNRLKDDALRLKEEEDSTIRKCRDKMNSIQSKYNLLYIRRQHRSGVSWSQVLICLERLDQYYFEELIGTSLRIGPSGQFCAFANDGSILVPWNFISEWIHFVTCTFFWPVTFQQTNTSENFCINTILPGHHIFHVICSFRCAFPVLSILHWAIKFYDLKLRQ